jgi:hypothetical protein
MQPFAGLHPSTTRPILIPKLEQRFFCSAQNHTSLGVKLAYDVVFVGDPSKEKAGNFTWYKEVLGFLMANLKFTVQSASSYGRVRKAVQTRKENPFPFPAGSTMPPNRQISTFPASFRMR